MKRSIPYIIFLVGLWACKEKYVAEVIPSDKNLLVVEGFINVGTNAVTTIVLSRSTELSNATSKYETKAKIEIQAKGGGTYPLTESSTGTYTSPSLNLFVTDSYRLHITTSNGKEYFSDYAAAKTTPIIQGVSLERVPDGGLRIFTDSKITPNDSRYYQWKTEEVWEIHSKYESRFVFTKNSAGVIVGAAPTPGNVVNTGIKTCWVTQNATSIQLGNLERFTTDSIHDVVVTIPPSSPKLLVLYWIRVRQYAISHAGYLFLDAMRKNTETLGTIFDAQPSNLNGNIHCVSDPAEQVIGFVDVTQEASYQTFIKPSQIPGSPWVDQQQCNTKTVDSIVGLINYPGFLPLFYNDPSSPNPNSKGGDFGTATCVDCTLTGSNIKPPFWP